MDTVEDPTEPEAPPEEPAKTPEAALVRADKSQVSVEIGGVAPKNLDEQLKVAKWAIESGLLPVDVKKVATAWAIMQRGAELGFTSLGSFDFLYVVNGRVRMTPDAIKAKALASGLLTDVREEIVGTGEERFARVTVLRRGISSPIKGEFSVADARKARLWEKTSATGKPSAWVTYPERMLLARARGFAFGDAFKDLCGGLPIRERFDLDPGEKLGADDDAAGRSTTVRVMPAGPDPLIAELAPITHAEADAALAAEESGE